MLWGIEEYGHKDDLYEKHMKSDAFGTFAKALGDEKLFSKDLGLGNYAPASGFIVRPGQETNSGKYVWIAEVTCKDSAGRDEAIRLASPLTKYVYDNEPKTLSYLFLKSLDDDKKFTVFEIYENKQALTEIHHKGDEFKKFMGALAEKGLVAEKVATAFTSIGQGYFAKNGQGLGYRS